MASERKRSANRTNARASTGPRSAPGKSRVSRNALRHGLAVPIGCDAKVSAEIEALAKSIVGPRASPDLLPLALRIAEAQLDLVRIRRVRHDLFSKALSDPDYESSASTRLKMKLVVALARKQGATTPMPSWAEGIVMRKPSGPEKFAVILSDMARKLAAIERYERRAIRAATLPFEHLIRHVVWLQGERSERRPNRVGSTKPNSETISIRGEVLPRVLR